MRLSTLHGTADDVAMVQLRDNPQRRLEESLGVAIVLSVAGGYLDAFTWIAHDGVMANAQTANVVLLGVYAAMGQAGKALDQIPPIAAFMVGVFAVYRLRARIRDRRLEPDDFSSNRHPA